jgi:excisionase family DNA binding protein
MRTLGLKQAAEFLKVHPEELRRRAKSGAVPGAKVGRSWVFLDEDLAAYLRSLYAPSRQALRVTLDKEVSECHFANVVQSGGSTLSLPMENEYAALLGLGTKLSRKNSTTN